MPDLRFQVEGAEPQQGTLTPQLLFRLRLAENVPPGRTPAVIRAVLLQSQVRIEPARRRYDAVEQERLLDLFGTPERWGQTLRPLLWAQAVVLVPPFEGETAVDLPVPCSHDFNLAGTKFCDALGEGDIPLCLLFSGTIFYESDDGRLQVGRIAWEKEASYRLPAATWRALLDLHHPNSAWLCLRKDVFGRLAQYRSREGLATWEQALDRLLSAEEAPTP